MLAELYPGAAFQFNRRSPPVEQSLIDWDMVAEDVNMGRQPEALLDLITKLSGRSEIKALAESCGIPEWKAIVAVVATRQGRGSWTAHNLARTLLDGCEWPLLLAAQACVPA
jgi:hypothetical protein